MRTSGISVMFALIGALATTACSDLTKLGKEAQSGLNQAQAIQKQVEAAKKGDVGAAADIALSTSVKGALEKDPKTRGSGIEVSAKGGVVHLKGRVAADVKAEAEKIAKGVPGVTKVATDDDKKDAKATKDSKITKDAKDTKDVKDPAAKPVRDSGATKDSGLTPAPSDPAPTRQK